MKRWVHASTEQLIENYDRVVEVSDSIEFKYSDNPESQEAAEAVYNNDPEGFIQRYATSIAVGSLMLDDNGMIICQPDAEHIQKYGTLLDLQIQRKDGSIDGAHVMNVMVRKPSHPQRFAKLLSNALKRKLDYLLSKELLRELKD